MHDKMKQKCRSEGDARRRIEIGAMQFSATQLKTNRVPTRRGEKRKLKNFRYRILFAIDRSGLIGLGVTISHGVADGRGSNARGPYR